MAKLTKKRIEVAVISASVDGKDKWLGDGDGLFARCAPSGRVFLTYQYWVGGRGGRPKRVTLGRFGEVLPDGTELTLAKARTLAAIERGKVRSGQDPAADKRLTREKLTGQTLADAWTRYREAKGRDNSTWREYDRLVRFDALPVLGKLPVAMVREDHLAALRDRVTKRSASTARGLWAALRPFFKWSRENGLVAVNPMRELASPKPLPKRKRYLSTDEITAYLAAVETLGHPWRAVFRLLLLLAARREEIAGMRWDEVDGPVWTLPPARSKNGQEHSVDLPPQAREVLAATPQQHALVFTTTGTTPPSGFSKAKRQLDEAMKERLGGKFKPFRLHDLRRTMVTHAGETLGVDKETLERVLNHTKAGIEGVYQQQTLRLKRKEALIAWANYIDALDAMN